MTGVQFWVLIIFGLLAFIFGILGMVAGFRYAKDIFTPTRKSVLISGVFIALAVLSCMVPSIVLADQRILQINGVFDVFILLLCVGGPMLILTLSYVIPRHLHITNL